MGDACVARIPDLAAAALRVARSGGECAAWQRIVSGMEHQPDVQTRTEQKTGTSGNRTLRERVPRYLASLPERMTRAAAAVAGGTLYETSNVAVPRVVRESKLYQATIARLLRIVIEWVGDVRGIYAEETTTVEELTKRKFAGNVVELASILAVGFSPLWLLAAASDILGGSKTYLRALVAELQKTGHLPRDADVTSYEDLLGRLETGSGVLADAIDIPPMTLRDARVSFAALRRQAHDLPHPDELAALYRDLQETARREGQTVGGLSAAIGLAAARAGVEVGNTHVFGFYRDALEAIRAEGFLRFLRRVASPYLARAGRHFDPRAGTLTERFLHRLEQQRAGSGARPNP
jgi:hypothetical protein